MEIVFVRHAEKEKDQEDPKLSDMGILQAEELAKRLEKEKFDKIYCSNLKRAVQTAEIICKCLHEAPNIEESLREFSVDILKKSDAELDDTIKEKYEGLKTFLKELTKDPNAEQKILIVAHGNTNRIILSELLELGLKNLVRFGQIETAVNRVYWLGKFNNWRLKDWNDVNHLPENLLGKEIY